jgi:hypothetical protein
LLRVIFLKIKTPSLPTTIFSINRYLHNISRILSMPIPRVPTLGLPRPVEYFGEFDIGGAPAVVVVGLVEVVPVDAQFLYLLHQGLDVVGRGRRKGDVGVEGSFHGFRLLTIYMCFYEIRMEL